MKKTLLFILITTFTLMASAQNKITLTAGNRSMTASLADNTATRELVALLQQGPITVQMSDYGGFEKVGALPRSFTTSNTKITTQPGDIMLYQGCNMVIFYGSNSWSYTRLGKIDGATAAELKQFLGNGSIALTISLHSSDGIEHVTSDPDTRDVAYDLMGKLVAERPLPSGCYIINGKKTLVRHR